MSIKITNTTWHIHSLLRAFYLFTAVFACAEVAVFQQGASNPLTGIYTGVHDATIRNGNDRNYGGDTILTFGGGFSVLLQFDLSSLNSASPLTIKSAVLELAPRISSAETRPVSFRIHVLNRGHAGWQQGAGIGKDVSSPGEVSFFYRSYKEGEWTRKSGFSIRDYSAEAVYKGIFNPSAPKTVVHLPPELILSWIEKPEQNAGLVIVSDDTAYGQVRSSEYKTVAERPRLNITYTSASPVNVETGVPATGEIVAVNKSVQKSKITDENPVDIGSNRELFIDEFLIDQLSGSAELRLQTPQIRETVLNFDQPWEGNACGYLSIFKDDSIYKMYYRGCDVKVVDRKAANTHSNIFCYAESKDGINWERPELGLFDFNGSKKNNIVIASGQFGDFHLDVGDNASFFKDENPKVNPDEKYKALVCVDEGNPRSLYAMKSADGIHWLPLSIKPVLTNGEMDSLNLAFWDEKKGEYRAYWRFFNRSMLHPDGSSVGSVRSVRTATSKDFIHWENEADLTYDNRSTDQLYTSGIKPYYRAKQILIGLPARYVERTGNSSLDLLPGKENRDIRGTARGRLRSAITDTFLIASRDGVHFKKWEETFLRPGIERWGTWAYGDAYAAWGMLETASALEDAPNEISIYAQESYWTGSKDHNGNKLRRYTLRLDGFSSVHASRNGGELLTKPLIFKGEELLLNFSTSAGGSVRVEIQSPDGTLIPGYSLEECMELFGDSTQRAVTWLSGNNLKDISGRPVRVRFVLNDADLFAFGFADEK
ncbi:MAG: hypothetical protein WC959_00965 [Kiritimatiellales bacterium]